MSVVSIEASVLSPKFVDEFPVLSPTPPTAGASSKIAALIRVGYDIAATSGPDPAALRARLTWRLDREYYGERKSTARGDSQ